MNSLSQQLCECLPRGEPWAGPGLGCWLQMPACAPGSLLATQAYVCWAGSLCIFPWHPGPRYLSSIDKGHLSNKNFLSRSAMFLVCSEMLPILKENRFWPGPAIRQIILSLTPLLAMLTFCFLVCWALKTPSPRARFFETQDAWASLMQSCPLKCMPVAVFFILGIWVLISSIPLRLARF